MTSIYSNVDLLRKMTTIKDRLYTDGFYNTKLVLRTKTETIIDNDPFKVNNTTVITDNVIDCIAEKNPEYRNFGKSLEVFSGDVRLTVRSTDKNLVIKADELWLEVDIIGTDTIIYDNVITKTFTKGIEYSINSRKPSILEYDEIFVLREVGKLNGEE